jgi:hypothetical protein
MRRRDEGLLNLAKWAIDLKFTQSVRSTFQERAQCVESLAKYHG